MGAPETIQRVGWQARLALGFARQGAATRLVQREHEGPLCVQRPLYPQGDSVCHVIVLHPPGGIAGGDELDMTVEAGAGSHALLTTPGATKWYRTGGASAHQRTALQVGQGAVMEWLPQEAIVFDGARAEIGMQLALGEGATFIGWDILCLGRAARGERFERGMVRMRTEVHRAGRPLWVERGKIDGGASVMTSPVGLAGCSVTGTLLAASARLNGDLLNACREIVPAQGMHGVTLLPELLVVRYLGDSAEAARAYFTRIWMALRVPLTGMLPVAPRIWST